MKFVGTVTDVKANYFKNFLSNPVENYWPYNEGLYLLHCSVKALGPLLFGSVKSFRVISYIFLEASNSYSRYLSSFSLVSL